MYQHNFWGALLNHLLKAVLTPPPHFMSCHLLPCKNWSVLVLAHKLPEGETVFVWLPIEAPRA
jgi:hypothetical protein